MTKAYSYLRFSTPEQQKGDSTRRQTLGAQTYAAQHGLDLQDVSYSDLGVSAFRGANADAGRLGEFLQAVRDGIIERGSYLLVESLDRISRNKPRKAVRILEDICEAGIAVVTLSDQKVYTEADLDDSGMTFMWAFMVAMRAHEESAMKGRRLKAAWGAKRAKAADKPLTARGPAWLVLNADTRQWNVIEERADVVRRIYNMKAGGVGQNMIAEVLNKEGVPTFGDAQLWHRSYVVKILDNPAVIGTFTPHENLYDGNNKKRRNALEPVEGYFPAVIDLEIYHRVQALAQTKSSGRGRHAASEIQSLVAGLARCPLCGSTMTRKSPGKSHGRPYLVCTKAKAGAGCVHRSVPLVEVETAIIERVGELKETVPAPAQREGEIDDELETLEESILGVEEAVGVLLDQLSLSPSPAIRDRIRALENDLLLKKTQRDTLLAARAQASAPALEKKVWDLVTLLSAETLDTSAANLKLRQLVSDVTVDWQWGQLVLHWHHGGTSKLQYGWPEEQSL